MPLIKLTALNKVYQQHKFHHRALTNIDLTIEQGEMVAIMGASGSGKSTLMNMIGLLDHPTSGYFYFADLDVMTLDEDAKAKMRNQQIGFVFQSFFLLPHIDAVQNVMLPLFYRGVHTKIARARAIDLLTQLGLGSMLAYKPMQLSGGQQQRVAIARALIGEPQLLLADEPTGALDSQTSQEVMNIFLSLNREKKKTIVIVTHDKEVSCLCSRVVKLKDGAIVADERS